MRSDLALDRAAGALLGVHAGDSLGATVEFMDWASVRAAYPTGVREIVGGGPFRRRPGAATDDTDLTRAVALGYAQQVGDGGDVVRTVADRMVDWWRGDWPGRRRGTYPKDIRHATATGLRAYAHHGDPTRSGAGKGSACNGSLMRCIPTAIVRADRDVRHTESAAISAITHDDPRCLAACVVYNDAVDALVDGADAAGALACAHDSANAVGVEAVVAAMRLGERLDLAAMAATGDNPLPDAGRGFVLDSLSIAIAALVDRRTFEEVVVDVVRLGGDTDTNAAIAGGLRGAIDGGSAIPARWVDNLQFAAEFRTLAAEPAAARTAP